MDAAAAAEAAVLAEITSSRSGAEHFRVLGLLGTGEFGYVFKVRICVDQCAATRVSDVCVGDRHQVCCTHPRHPNPRKQYALKLIINYATLSDERDIAERCGRDGIVLRILPRHTNLCAVLAEFISDVPDEMFEYLTPVRVGDIASQAEYVTGATDVRCV